MFYCHALRGAVHLCEKQQLAKLLDPSPPGARQLSLWGEGRRTQCPEGGALAKVSVGAQAPHGQEATAEPQPSMQMSEGLRIRSCCHEARAQYRGADLGLPTVWTGEKEQTQ